MCQLVFFEFTNQPLSIRPVARPVRDTRETSVTRLARLARPARDRVRRRVLGRAGDQDLYVAL